LENLLYWACVAGFVGLAPAVLTVRALDPTWMSWRNAIVLAAVFGWLFLNGAAWFHTPVDAGSSGASSGVVLNESVDPGRFVLLFGWLVGLAYFAPLAAFYALAQWLRRDPHGRRVVRSSSLRTISGSDRGRPADIAERSN
jgi:hypothetical protein